MIVDCDFRKWGNAPHYRFAAELLDQDTFGTWLGCTPPLKINGPHGPGEWLHAFVILIPVSDWWIASFNDDRHPEIDTYVDIATPATWHSPEHLTSVDLDLDVIRFWDGRVILDDEDEFEAHQTKYGYPADVVRAASDAAERLMRLVQDRVEPFGSVGADRLERLLSETYDRP